MTALSHLCRRAQLSTLTSPLSVQLGPTWYASSLLHRTFSRVSDLFRWTVAGHLRTFRQLPQSSRSERD
jgi:hypothetical protein